VLPKAVLERTPAPHAVDVCLAERELPVFAEYGAFCWGEVDYESRGDCGRPTDRGWSWLEVRARAGGERLLVFRPEPAETSPGFPHPLRVEAASSRLAWLGVYMTMRRVPSVAWLRRRGHMIGYGALADQLLVGEDVDARWERAGGVRAQFGLETLRAYDSMDWWGGWKWTGAFSSPSAWPLRRVMHAVASRDTSALGPIVEALERDERREGHLHALQTLAGRTFVSDDEWRAWWRHRQAEA